MKTIKQLNVENEHFLEILRLIVKSMINKERQ